MQLDRLHPQRTLSVVHLPDLEADSENSLGSNDWRRFTRAELDAKVWSEPMVESAKAFGIY